ncbi:MAG: methionyl-tRNA formyltransferase [Gammaproteobacteria bacterium]|nr:methionyl-tRNA formyltransferase [Gammaproteobacteria bacterium]
MHRLRTIFAGTPEFAVPSLEALLAHPAVDLVAVYTQPDRPAGRGRRLTASPIKHRAVTAGITVLQPDTLAGAAALAEFGALAADLLVVAAYGLILPTALLELPRHAINVHASLLPRWRGAAPIQRAILAGDTESGISIMRIVPALDAGPVWLRRPCDITADETGGSLHDKLARLGGAALREALDLIVENRVSETPQDASLVTYAAKLGAADREIDWHASAHEIERRVRALSPLPAARAPVLGVDCKILGAQARAASVAGPPGRVVDSTDDAVLVATGDGTLAITRLQPAGRQAMSATAFMNGYGAQS